MEKNKKLRVVTILMLSLFALSLLSISVKPALAYSFPKSDKVALVPDADCVNGGNLYTGTSFPNGDSFTFTNLSPASIRDDATDPIEAGGYDTVMLMTSDFDFEAYWADTDFQSRITSFVNEGGKLIIYTSESYSSYADNFASFIYPFTVDTPGATGSTGGTVVNLADDTLSSSTVGDASYVDLTLLTSGTDAVGDCTVMTSVDPNWYIDMTAINVRGVGGPAHTYAFYGAGLMIFNGFDIDYGDWPIQYTPGNTVGGEVVQMIWYLELCGQELGEGQSVSGLSLLPATDTNPVNTMHTVTAQVKDSINNPVEGVEVTFQIISGPNAGSPTTATTDANGEATFSWSSSIDGTDTVQASATNAAGAPVTATATKNWYIVPSNVIPEVPFGTAAITATMIIGLAAFYTRKRTKTPKL